MRFRKGVRYPHPPRGPGRGHYRAPKESTTSEQRTRQEENTAKLKGSKTDKRRSRMSIFKRGRIYWYKFTFNGEAIRESTRQTNQHIARQMEAAHRSSLAKGE